LQPHAKVVVAVVVVALPCIAHLVDVCAPYTLHLLCLAECRANQGEKMVCVATFVCRHQPH